MTTDDGRRGSRSSACWDRATWATTGRSTRCCGYLRGATTRTRRSAASARGPEDAGAAVRHPGDGDAPGTRRTVPAGPALTTIVAQGLRQGGRPGPDAVAGCAGTTWSSCPGMGVLETTLELQPWGFPYALFLMCVSARIVGARVAFVSVGAERRPRAVDPVPVRRRRAAGDVPVVPGQPIRATRCGRWAWTPARTRSTPTSPSRLPDPEEPESRDPRRTIGLGVMEYHGAYGRPGSIGRDLLAATSARSSSSPAGLVDEGYRIRLRHRRPVRRGRWSSAIIDDLRRTRPDLVGERVIREPADSLGELMEQLAGCRPGRRVALPQRAVRR